MPYLPAPRGTSLKQGRSRGLASCPTGPLGAIGQWTVQISTSTIRNGTGVESGRSGRHSQLPAPAAVCLRPVLAFAQFPAPARRESFAAVERFVGELFCAAQRSRLRSVVPLHYGV